MTANILFSYLSIRSYNIVISYECIFDLRFGFNYVSITYLTVTHVGFDTKDIVAANTHDVIFFRCWFEDDDGALFDDIVISKYDFEIFLLSLADDGAGWIYDTALSEYNISYNLI